VRNREDDQFRALDALHDGERESLGTEDDRGNTFRAVYTVKFAGWVCVLHCFQKKSKSGIKTPKEDMDLIHARLKAAKLDFEAWQTKQGAR